MFTNLFHKLANKRGYFRLSQLKVGGMCGCCGNEIPDLIWVDYQNGDNWADIGVCNVCATNEDNFVLNQTRYKNAHKFELAYKNKFSN